MEHRVQPIESPAEESRFGTEGRDVSRDLAEVEWDFLSARTTRASIHSFHSYPARFIPEIPRAFIGKLKPPAGTLVFDPFCGCGTTLVEAQFAGFESVGVDLNPIACLITRIKTTTLPSNLVEIAQHCVSRAKDGGPRSRREIPNLAHWFEPQVCDALDGLLAAIREIEVPETAQALEGVLSSIIVRVSNQESDTRYAAVQKSITRDGVLEAFIGSAKSLAEGGSAHSTRALQRATVINRNIFDVVPSDIPGEVGLVVTSPPYPNAYEYWLYHKYRMWWLGYDPLFVKSHEIGARAHFFTGRHKKEDFKAQMRHVFGLLANVMRKGAYCCVVVGDSKIHGKIVDNGSLIQQAAAECGFDLAFSTRRNINAKRKSFNLHHARNKHEHVFVWRK